MNIADTAAAVITEARRAATTGENLASEHALTTAQFDHDIAVNGVGGLYGPLGQAAYTIVRQGMPGATTDEVEAAWHTTWTALAPELDAYAARCRSRQYTGWSNANRNPIRYA